MLTKSHSNLDNKIIIKNIFNFVKMNFQNLLLKLFRNSSGYEHLVKFNLEFCYSLQKGFVKLQMNDSSTYKKRHKYFHNYLKDKSKS